MDIHCLLLLGLYQIVHIQTAAHAAVSETVSVTRQLKKNWAKSLVNAVLRNFLREQTGLLAECGNNERFNSAHPEWLLNAIRQAWPNDWHSIVEANNQQAPMWLRVNLQKTSAQNYLTQLQDAGINASIQGDDAAILLGQATDVTRLPGFAEGYVSVQDGAAQLAARIIDLQPGQRVLDACAAPGGKMAHMLEIQPALALMLALDKDADRLNRVDENLQRLGLTASVLTADAGSPNDWWDGQQFDRILLDSPCSGTGVIRRHPDIKALRKPADIQATSNLQANLLAALWPLLKAGGKLLYATCSILPQENSLQIERFLQAQHDASLLPNWPGVGRDTSPGLQILPGESSMDGFYYACLQKT
jgi:16S rRNA (cytosine967-C5)-methyltransferase